MSGFLPQKIPGGKFLKNIAGFTGLLVRNPTTKGPEMFKKKDKPKNEDEWIPYQPKTKLGRIAKSYVLDADPVFAYKTIKELRSKD